MKWLRRATPFGVYLFSFISGAGGGQLFVLHLTKTCVKLSVRSLKAKSEGEERDSSGWFWRRRRLRRSDAYACYAFIFLSFSLFLLRLSFSSPQHSFVKVPLSTFQNGNLAVDECTWARLSVLSSNIDSRIDSAFDSRDGVWHDNNMTLDAPKISCPKCAKQRTLVMTYSRCAPGVMSGHIRKIKTDPDLQCGTVHRSSYY